MSSGTPKIDRFVNPYTFLGLPAQICRQRPTGHNTSIDNGGERLLYGTITLRWTLQTPMLLPECARDEDWVADTQVRIPGSSMKGVLRSAHETLFNGCLRVVNDDFVPSYRDAANQGPDADQWHVAVVTEAKHGTPLKLALCLGEPEWVEATSLKRAYAKARKPLPGLPTTSDILDIPDRSAEAPLDRLEIRNVSVVRDVNRPTVTKNATGTERAGLRTGSRVLLVTDTAARKKDRAGRTARGRAFWATGIVSDGEFPVSEDVARRFIYKSSGSRDRQDERRSRADTTLVENRYEDVRWWPDLEGPLENFTSRAVPVARRLKATGELHAGDVIWAKVRGPEGTQEVVDLRMSVLWRHLGGRRLGERLPGPRHASNADLLACRHPFPPGNGKPYDDGFPHGLCLSCMIFGTADTAGEVSKQGHQDGYAGHVRVGAAVSDTPVGLRRVQLAPMGEPHPGAGMFYLAPSDPDRAQRPDGDLPSHWGAASDPGRQVRGRKFYWHADPEAQASFWEDEGRRRPVPRYEARQHHQQRPGQRVTDRSRNTELVPAGTTFTQRVYIDGLNRPAVASLLAAADPGRALGLIDGGQGRRFGLHLGGGKPLGLGSVVAEVDSTSLATAANRYTGAQEPATSVELTRPDLLSLYQDGWFSRHAGQLVRILDVEGLGDWHRYVSYPPGADWSQLNTREFDESFVFFKQYSGEKLAGTDHPYVPLPQVPNDPMIDFDPSLPVASRQRGQRRPRR